MFVCLFYPPFCFASLFLHLFVNQVIFLPTLLPYLTIYTPPHPVSVTLYDFLVFQPHSLYFPHQFQPIYIPVSPSSFLSFPLKSVTYIQHSCLMNNGGETVTISISIRRISFDLCYSQLLYCLSSQLSSQVSSHFLSHVIFTPRFFSLLTVCILQQ